MVWQEIQNLDLSRKSLRSFGYGVGTVLIGIALVVLWRRGWTLGAIVYGLGGIGAVLVLMGLLAPAMLRPVYRVWMALALVLGYVMTRVVLTLVFFLLVTPIGLVLRALGKDPLQRDVDTSASSYWIAKEEATSSPVRLEKYY